MATVLNALRADGSAAFGRADLLGAWGLSGMAAEARKAEADDRAAHVNDDLIDIVNRFGRFGKTEIILKD